MNRKIDIHPSLRPNNIDTEDEELVTVALLAGGFGFFLGGLFVLAVSK